MATEIEAFLALLPLFIVGNFWLIYCYLQVRFFKKPFSDHGSVFARTSLTESQPRSALVGYKPFSLSNLIVGPEGPLGEISFALPLTRFIELTYRGVRYRATYKLEADEQVKAIAHFHLYQDYKIVGSFTYIRQYIDTQDVLIWKDKEFLFCRRSAVDLATRDRDLILQNQKTIAEGISSRSRKFIVFSNEVPPDLEPIFFLLFSGAINVFRSSSP